MIAPRNRLLFWFALIVLPFALLGGVEPAARGISLAAIGGFVVLVLADAIGAPAGLAGISLELPGISRMTKDREARIEVRVRNQGQKAKTLRLALSLPREFRSQQEDLTVSLPAGAELSRLTWPCLPLCRGSYRLQSAYAETASPLGFWSLRKKAALEGEIRVYPDMFSERKHLAALFLPRGAFGLLARRQLGKGREFEKLREYTPGDGYDEVHWKATARRGRPITKVFQVERTQEIYVIIDASRLSARPVPMEPGRKPAQAPPAGPDAPPPTLDPPPTALERFITAGLVLGLAAERQGDLFGLLTFSDKVERFVRAKNGKAHYHVCRDALYTLHPKIVTPDFDEVCTFIRLRLRRRALLVFLTALDDPVLAESFVRNMDLLRNQHLVLVNMLQPAGVAPVFTNPNVASVDDLYAQLGGHLLWADLRELEKVLQRRGVRFSMLGNERLSAELVSQYLAVKQRQAL
jgi:uncharacterized protein (DUF58 family)